MKTIAIQFSALLLMVLLAGCGWLAFGTTYDLAGTQWQLERIDDTAPVVGTTITLNFDQESVGGSAGCNTYGGDYRVQDNNLSISRVFSTMMACMDDGVMQQEQDYLALLEMTTSYTLTGNTLTLITSDGHTLFFVTSSNAATS